MSRVGEPKVSSPLRDGLIASGVEHLVVDPRSHDPLKARREHMSKCQELEHYNSFIWTLYDAMVSGRTLVFLARDALPLMEGVKHLAAAKDGPPAVYHIAVTRAMLPKPLRDKINACDSARTTESFIARQSLIRRYVRTSRWRKSRLSQYICQQRPKHKAVTLVDIGFWGTCTELVAETWRNDTPNCKDIETMLLFGPKGSPHHILGRDPEATAGRSEGKFNFDHDYTGKFRRDLSGMLTPVREDKTQDTKKKYEAELDGLRERLTPMRPMPAAP